MGVSLDLRMSLLNIGRGSMLEGENRHKRWRIILGGLSVAWLVIPSLLEF